MNKTLYRTIVPMLNDLETGDFSDMTGGKSTTDRIWAPLLGPASRVATQVRNTWMESYAYQTKLQSMVQLFCNACELLGVQYARVNNQNIRIKTKTNDVYHIRAWGPFLILADSSWNLYPTDANLRDLRNKTRTVQVLKDNDIPVAGGEGRQIKGSQIDEDFDQFPAVVKSECGTLSDGVHIVEDRTQADSYLSEIRSKFPSCDVRIEPFKEGQEYRCYVLGTKLVSMHARCPEAVQGDGKTTIEQLIKAARQSNKKFEKDDTLNSGSVLDAGITRLVDRVYRGSVGKRYVSPPGLMKQPFMKQGDEFTVSGDGMLENVRNQCREKIAVNWVSVNMCEGTMYKPGTVTVTNVFDGIVYLNNGTSFGDPVRAYVDTVHPDNLEMFGKLNTIFGTTWIGLDVKGDLSKSHKDGDGPAIIEVNAAPQIDIVGSGDEASMAQSAISAQLIIQELDKLGGERTALAVV